MFDPFARMVADKTPTADLQLSVVVAAYNDESVIAESLSRIACVLATRPGVDWEIVCVDDGSLDRTGVLLDEAAASDPRIRVLHHRRNFLGRGGRCGRGLTRAAAR